MRSRSAFVGRPVIQLVKTHREADVSDSAPLPGLHAQEDCIAEADGGCHPLGEDELVRLERDEASLVVDLLAGPEEVVGYVTKWSRGGEGLVAGVCISSASGIVLWCDG